MFIFFIACVYFFFSAYFFQSYSTLLYIAQSLTYLGWFTYIRKQEGYQEHLSVNLSMI